MDQHQQTSRHPNHNWLRKLHTRLQAVWIMCPSSLPPDLDLQMKCKIYFIWKEDFGPLSNSPFIFLRSPGKMLLTMFLFRSGLVALSWRRLSMVTLDALTPASVHSLWSSQVFESALLDSILKLAVIPVACAPFYKSKLWNTINSEK